MSSRFGRVTIDKADQMFSEYIRIRDGRCVRCGRLGSGPKGIFGLQCSHFHGRGRESTRFDEENADALCPNCHHIWGSEDHEAYRAFKVKQLGQQRFDLLTVRANTYQKRDRKLAYIYWKERLKQLTDGNNS